MKLKQLFLSLVIFAFAVSLVACNTLKSDSESVGNQKYSDGTSDVDSVDGNSDPDIFTDENGNKFKCNPHKDKNDNAECDACGKAFTDGCDNKACLDTDNDGKCDNDGCDKATANKPQQSCAHKDKNDDLYCDLCDKPFSDGCDTAPCLDTDNDGVCNDPDCTKTTANKPQPRPCNTHVDADDNSKCDVCGFAFSDGCDVHTDKNDNGACDVCDAPFSDGCDVHADKDDDGACDVCEIPFADGCDVHVDKNDDYICDNAGCNAGCDDGVDDGTHRVIENYLPDALTEIVYREFENKSPVFARMHQGSMPFAYFDHITLSNCRILSITLPILIAKDADENGDFIFTIHEINNSFDGLSKSPVKSYKLKINKDVYGITPGDTEVYKLVTIDLADLGIVLSSNETIAFGDAGDTVIPAYLHRDQKEEFAASKAYDQYFEQGVGVLKKIGTGYKVDTPTLCINLSVERTYESEESYDQMIADELRYEQEFAAVIAQLKEIYKGKKVSVLGDSISTFEGLSDNSSINSSLKDHKSDYYPSYDETVDEFTETYWGRLIADLDMSLCVDNGWSGTHVVGSNSRNHVDSAPERANQLHRNDGTKPDVIIFYMGTNDMDSHRKSSGAMPFGSLYNKLKVDDGRSDEEKVAEWWDGVLNTYKNNGNKAIYGTTYKDFEQAYALALYLMMQNYPGVEIICMNLIQNHYSGLTADITAKFNRAINAICAYFGITVADQSSEYAELTHENNFLYSASIDDVAVHPNETGHLLMERLIIKTLAEKHGIALPTKPTK